MKNPIVIFYHIYCFTHQHNNWEVTVREQLQKLIDSGLYDACTEIFVRVIGEVDDIKKYYDMSSTMKKIEVICADNNNDREVTTLKAVHQYAKENSNTNILYIHTKGVHSGYNRRQKYTIKANDWRHLMEYFVIENWEKCVVSIENGYDVCGINWRLAEFFNEMLGHFSGNFWWAKSFYIKSLPEVKRSKYRGEQEFWIGRGEPNVCCMYESGINHYRTYYPREFYVNKES